MRVGRRAALETFLEAPNAAGLMVRPQVSARGVFKRALRSACRSMLVDVELTDMFKCGMSGLCDMYNEIYESLKRRRPLTLTQFRDHVTGVFSR